MPDSVDKLSGVIRLPIFPLPLVLLPNELLPLHIFEDRYRAMLADVKAGTNLFGITLFESNESFIDRPPVGTVGTAAQVRDSEMLPDGRSNILTVGTTRYRLLEYVDSGEPYLVAEVEFFSDEQDDTIKGLADEVFLLFERMAKAAFTLGGNRGEMPAIQPSDPEALSFLITAAFNFENEKKQLLLEMASTSERLLSLKEILDTTVVQLEETAAIQAVSKTNGHSKKKLDL
jgi:Lon protease-like protein